MAKQTIGIGSAANDGTGDPLRTAFDKTNDNFNEIYADDFVTGSRLADDSVDFDKLGAEFTTSSAVTTALDFSAAQVFTKTMTADTTFTYSNVGIGMVKDFILTGAFVPTFPSGTKTVAGTYDGSVSNLIQIVAVASGDYWMSISKAQ
jgi:hypothetical protein